MKLARFCGQARQEGWVGGKLPGPRDIWGALLSLRNTLCLKNNIPDIFDCNLKNNYQILIIFGTNISDTTSHQMTV